MIRYLSYALVHLEISRAPICKELPGRIVWEWISFPVNMIANLINQNRTCKYKPKSHVVCDSPPWPSQG